MNDEIRYDYASMDNAFEDMMRINSAISSQQQELEAEASRVLASAEGTYANRYNAEQQAVRELIQNSNEFLKQKAVALQEQFDLMGQTDHRLGDGI